jgi:CPA2 family monovalent cation:H+ antiporter-2
MPPLIGYVVAGIAIGPNTPGVIIDSAFTRTMAEVGVGLLLFGVGLHFRPKDLLAVWRVALPFIVVEENRARMELLRRQAVPVRWGNGTQPEMPQAARIAQAGPLIVPLPLAWKARRVVELARAAYPRIKVAVRAHQDSEVGWLHDQDSAGLAVMGEREVALGIADFAMQRMGVAASTAQATIDVLRKRRVADAAVAGLGA